MTLPLSAPAAPLRRRLMLALAASLAAGPARSATPPLTVCTFGDSILDCAHYNDAGLHPAGLLVANDDGRFPEFRGRDLASTFGPARLEHRARDGATIASLPAQLDGLRVAGPAIALVTVGGNDLLAGLAGDPLGHGIAQFAGRLERVLDALPIRPLLLGNVYDPTLGDDRRNFLSVPAPVARRNLQRMNDAIARLAPRYGRLADLHAHFSRGRADWFTRTIEPSLVGASEVRRVFLGAAVAVLPRG